MWREEDIKQSQKRHKRMQLDKQEKLVSKEMAHENMMQKVKQQVSHWLNASDYSIGEIWYGFKNLQVTTLFSTTKSYRKHC